MRIANTNNEIAPVILNQLLALMNAQGRALFTYDPVGGESTCTLGIGLWERWSGVRLGPGEGAVGRQRLSPEAARRCDPVGGACLRCDRCVGCAAV